MKEMDCVEVTVEKNKYARDGVHKGMQGWICDSRNIRFVLDNVNNKELIAHYAQHNISLYSGKVYSALLSCRDIIKSFLA